MKLPDLSDVEAAGLREHGGTAEAIADILGGKWPTERIVNPEVRK